MNLAKDIGLKVPGFLSEPGRVVRDLPSARLVSVSEPPIDVVSSLPSDTDATPFSSRARLATALGPFVAVCVCARQLRSAPVITG